MFRARVRVRRCSVLSVTAPPNASNHRPSPTEPAVSRLGQPRPQALIRPLERQSRFGAAFSNADVTRAEHDDRHHLHVNDGQPASQRHWLLQSRTLINLGLAEE